MSILLDFSINCLSDFSIKSSKIFNVFLFVTSKLFLMIDYIIIYRKYLTSFSLFILYEFTKNIISSVQIE